MGLRYGQGKYGQFRYGRAESGFQFLAQISTDAGVIQNLLNNQIVSLNWEFNRKGGCGKFSCELKRQYDDFISLTAENLKALYDFRIYITSTVGGSSTLWYRGYIRNIRPSLTDNERVIISGDGYSRLLEDLIMHDGEGGPKIYTGKTISEIVGSIIDDFVTPSSDITEGDIDTFSTFAESIKFNESVTDALDKLSDIVGAEWGVDKDRELYFNSPSTTTGYRYIVGKDIGQIDDEVSYEDLVNEVIIEGGDVNDVPYRFIKRNQSSVDLFGLHQKRYSNSSIVDQTVAEVFATSIMSRSHIYSRNIRLTLPLNKTLIESSTPLPLIAIHKNPKQITHKYGTFKYGEQKYSGEQQHRIESIAYELKDLSVSTEIELNFGKPEINDRFKTLEFELDQQRQVQGV